MTRHSTRLLAAGVAVCASAAALTGCSAGSEAASCENTVVNPDAKVVTMWAWYPEFEGVVDLFNNSHDDVQICWSNAGAGNDEYTKLTTAVQAGSGPRRRHARERGRAELHPAGRAGRPHRVRRG
ncbi:hypothetical protein [Rathayibacter tanaceti]|uniref:hypothetical protein n=1 Tax=Rathayibacter tanaceti TaxID=1671680 RepID=UPI001372EC42|nr:hypothetical protein [Rathayibacter tanaceti]